MELRYGDLVLRPWTGDDVDDVLAACQDPEISRWIPFVPQPYTREDAEGYVHACLESGDERLPFAITDASSGELLGSIDLGLNEHRYRGHVGYWVVRHARGRGICTEALRIVTRMALEQLRVERMELITDPDTSPRSASPRRWDSGAKASCAHTSGIPTDASGTP